MPRTISEIIFSEMPGTHGNLGVITLNRPQALNALNHDMFLALDEHLIEWEQNKNIKAVVIQAVEGRAFCAGGDIRHAYHLKMKNDPILPIFFRDEYRMNTRIHHYPKPYIALLDGITMGGGVGISIHGSHPVATERMTFAMPETGIGFYPDVGCTYVLSRLPYHVGYYLGLTGARINSADCAAVGIVQEIVGKDSLKNILSTLAEAEITDKKAVTQILNQFAIEAPASELMQHQKEIELCFAKNTIEEIIEALEQFPSEWCHQTAKHLKTKSPTSLKVTLQALQTASKLNFDATMKMEYALTCQFIAGHDFFEGIRAVVIDKDQQPHWKPATIKEVTSKDVEKYFTPLSKELV